MEQRVDALSRARHCAVEYAEGCKRCGEGCARCRDQADEAEAEGGGRLRRSMSWPVKGRASSAGLGLEGRAPEALRLTRRRAPHQPKATLTSSSASTTSTKPVSLPNPNPNPNPNTLTLTLPLTLTLTLTLTLPLRLTR